MSHCTKANSILYISFSLSEQKCVWVFVWDGFVIRTDGIVVESTIRCLLHGV